MVIAIVTTTCCMGAEPKNVRRFYDFKSKRDLAKLNINKKPVSNGIKLEAETVTLPELFIGDFEVSIEVVEKTKPIRITTHGKQLYCKGGGKTYTLYCKAGYLYLSIYPNRHTKPAIPKVKIDSLRSKVAIWGSFTIKRVKINKGVVE
jgi:hypothetical protein